MIFFIQQFLRAPYLSHPKNRELTQKNRLPHAENKVNDRVDSKKFQDALTKEIDMKLWKMFESVRKEVIEEITTKMHKF